MLHMLLFPGQLLILHMLLAFPTTNTVQPVAIHYIYSDSHTKPTGIHYTYQVIDVLGCFLVSEAQ